MFDDTLVGMTLNGLVYLSITSIDEFLILFVVYFVKNKEKPLTMSKLIDVR